VLLKELARVSQRAIPRTGAYLYNGQRAIVLAIVKQSDTQLLQLRTSLGSVLAQLEAENPALAFELTQDQTQLLELSIDNLLSNLYVGGICAFLVMFLFLNEWKSPILIGLSIPITLLITFLFFYLLGISINILSLSGLILGVGMVVDSSIIVIENIIQFRQKGLSVSDACVAGTSEVILPLFTSILTNSAVFVPLLFLSGLAGALFTDQALSVSIALFVSLGVSLTLVPVMYRLLFQYDSPSQLLRLHQEPVLVRYTQRVYSGVLGAIFRFPRVSVPLFGLLLLIGLFTFSALPKQGMPSISRAECLVKIDWGQSISLTENERRIHQLVKQIKQPIVYSCALVGQQQFMLSSTTNQRINEAQLTIKVKNSADFDGLKTAIQAIFQNQFAGASLQVLPAPNVFEQLFNTSKPTLVAQVQSAESLLPPGQVQALTGFLEKQGIKVQTPALQEQIQVQILAEPLQLYGVSYESVRQQLNILFNQQQLTNLRVGDRLLPVVLNVPVRSFQTQLQTATVANRQGQSLPLRYFIKTQFSQDYKMVYTSQLGAFVPFVLSGQPTEKLLEVPALMRQFDPTLSIHLEGDFLDNQQLLQDIAWVMIVAIVLLYFILAAQFESLTQPLIVMVAIVFGLTGALLLLYAAQDSLNIMAGIGMIVLIGIVDNDSILKIDTMNKGLASLSLRESIEMAGKRRLKAQLMTTLTTLIGMLPTLFSSGLGAELQRPLALSVIGGILLGLVISNTFIPLIYWFNAKRLTKLTPPL
jgi:multidrug efflux pump subunit AcrB